MTLLATLGLGFLSIVTAISAIYSLNEEKLWLPLVMGPVTMVLISLSAWFHRFTVIGMLESSGKVGWKIYAGFGITFIEPILVFAVFAAGLVCLVLGVIQSAKKKSGTLH